uniref:Homing endonuclease LAGLIDADG domain-containing protein n=1 Tax=Dactylella sp. TaxID=1814903 RepID=A0A482DTP1_9PEZI|nr:hypothetical protein [Dactylella sp.]
MKPWASIGLNNREKFLLIKINNFFCGIGSIYETSTNNLAEWKVFKLANFNLLIEHFNSYPLKGFKGHNFAIWCKTIVLFNTEPLTPEIIIQIKELKNKLNKWE